MTAKTEKNKPTIFTCDDCNKNFASLANLKEHKLTHLIEKPYKCSVCDHRSARKFRLKVHELQHLRDKPFKCHQCSETFAQMRELTGHLTSHSNDKPHQCTECNQKYKTRGALKTHTNIVHCSERRFQCQDCQKKFKASGHLSRHRFLVHTEERPFKCDQCNYSSKLGHRMKCHKKAMHSDCPLFECTICLSQFKTVLFLNYHMILRHGVQFSSNADQDLHEASKAKSSNYFNDEIPEEFNDRKLVNNGFGDIIYLDKSPESDCSIDVEDTDSESELPLTSTAMLNRRKETDLDRWLSAHFPTTSQNDCHELIEIDSDTQIIEKNHLRTKKKKKKKRKLQVDGTQNLITKKKRKKKKMKKIHDEKIAMDGMECNIDRKKIKRIKLRVEKTDVGGSEYIVTKKKTKKKRKRNNHKRKSGFKSRSKSKREKNIIKLEPCFVKMERLSDDYVASVLRRDNFPLIKLENIKQEPCDASWNEYLDSVVPPSVHIINVKEEPNYY